jgi:hypothetical protein
MWRRGADTIPGRTSVLGLARQMVWFATLATELPTDSHGRQSSPDVFGSHPLYDSRLNVAKVTTMIRMTRKKLLSMPGSRCSAGLRRLAMTEKQMLAPARESEIHSACAGVS